MARKPSQLPGGVRLSDCLSLGVLMAKLPSERVDQVLQATGRQSRRQRQLPARLMVYYVIALTLYMEISSEAVLSWLLEGLSWLGQSVPSQWAGRAGLSQARIRLGVEPLRQLYEQTVTPIATAQTQGAWYRDFRLVSMDGTSLEVADTPDNEATFGRPGSGRGRSGFPQLRFVCLAESGTHVLFGAAIGGCRTSERQLAKRVVTWLQPQMLCLADRGFFGFALWQQAHQTGAQLLWRVSFQVCLPVVERLPDGSYLSKIYPRPYDRETDRRGVWVRVVDYRLQGVEGSEPKYRLLTTLLDPQQAPAVELAALYQERWEIELAFAELKTQLRGRRVVLRSKGPELVLQELYGLLLAHYGVRQLLHEAAGHAGRDPDELSFVHAVRVLRRKLPKLVASPPCAVAIASISAPRRDRVGAGQFQSGAPQPSRSEEEAQFLSDPPTSPGILSPENRLPSRDP